MAIKASTIGGCGILLAIAALGAWAGYMLPRNADDDLARQKALEHKALSEVLAKTAAEHKAKADKLAADTALLDVKIARQSQKLAELKRSISTAESLPPAPTTADLVWYQGKYADALRLNGHLRELSEAQGIQIQQQALQITTLKLQVDSLGSAYKEMARSRDTERLRADVLEAALKDARRPKLRFILGPVAVGFGAGMVAGALAGRR